MAENSEIAKDNIYSGARVASNTKQSKPTYKPSTTGANRRMYICTVSYVYVICMKVENESVMNSQILSPWYMYTIAREVKFIFHWRTDRTA
jgi:hypothetical protein